MKLGVVLEVDEIFTMIWLSSHPRSGSRSGDDLSPLSGLFSTFFIAFHIFVTDEHRDYKFGVQIDYSKSW